MRVVTRLVVVALLAGAAVVPEGGAITTIGRGRLLGSASVRVTYDSNIFVNSTEVSDLTTTVNGQLQYVRNAGVVTFEATTGASWNAFQDHSSENGIDPYFASSLAYQPSDKTQFRGSLNFRKNSLANDEVSDRTESNDLAVTVMFEHLTTEKLGFRLEGSVAQNNYITTGYSDVGSYSVGLHGVHQYSPKLKLLAGITTFDWLTEPEVAGRRSAGSRDLRYSVGAEGELASKVTGTVSVGFLDRGFDGTGFSDSSDLYLSGNLSWAAADKTTWSLQAEQNLSFTAADQSMKSSRLAVGVSQLLSEKLNFEGQLSVDRAIYTGFLGGGNRRDDGYSARASLNYSLLENAVVDFSAGYRHNDSSITRASYQRYNLGVGVSARF